jgi:hypothetical protein
MIAKNSIYKILKPGIPKRYLLLVAAFVWTFAGGMLLFRGLSTLILFPRLLWLKIIVCTTAGVIFYIVLFSRISRKHIQRIIRMQIERPCLFSFFNLRSYIMMTLMICLGITLRKTGVIPLEYLSAFYVAMGIPLLLSSFRFYYNSILFKKVVE